MYSVMQGAQLLTFQRPGAQDLYWGQPAIVWVGLGADLLIALACFGMFGLLIGFLRRLRNTQASRPLTWLVTISLLLLGLTHAVSIGAIWHLSANLLSALKIGAGLTALSTAFYLWKDLPFRVASTYDPGKTDGANGQPDGQPERPTCQEPSGGVSDLAVQTAHPGIPTTEARYRALIEVSPQIVWLADADGNNTYCNQTWYDYTGLTPEETLGDGWAEAIHPDDRPRISEAWANARALHTTFEIEVRFLRGRDGQPRWHLTKGLEVASSDLGHHQWMGVALDIHERKEAELERRTSEERLELAQEAAVMISWDINVKTNYVHSSGPVQEVLGTVPKTIPEYLKIIHPDDLPWYQDYLERAIQGEIEYDVEFRIIKPTDNSVQWIKGRGRRCFDDSKCVNRMLGISYNISQQKADEAEKSRLLWEIESKSKLLETILAQMPAAIFVGEAPTGKVIFANKTKIEEIFRYPYGSTASIQDYLQQVEFRTDVNKYEGKDWPLARAIMRGEKVCDEDAEFTRGDGTRGFIRVNAVPIKSENNRLIAGVVVCHDLTDLKRTEAELLQAKEEAESANRLKSSFLANMSHEIRTPVSVVMGFADLLADAETEAERRHCIDVMKKNGTLISVLINDILDLSRVEAGRIEIKNMDVSLRDLIEDTIASLRAQFEEKGLQLGLTIGKYVPERMRTDPHRFKQVLWNLLVNALKFTDHGSVNVSVSYETQKLTIDVSDTGIGIGTDHSANLFSPFTQLDDSTTRRYTGAGLGLALSQKLAHLLGGSLSLFFSEIGLGSIFRIEFTHPCTDDGNHAAEVLGIDPIFESQQSTDDVNLQGCHMLVVDDVSAMREIIQKYLIKCGAVVDFAIDGSDAVVKAGQRPYDVVIMDLQMPVLDGYAATRCLRDKGFNKPIIALTAHAMAESRIKCLKAGFTDWLTKPVNADDLLDMVNRYRKRSAPP